MKKYTHYLCGILVAVMLSVTACSQNSTPSTTTTIEDAEDATETQVVSTQEELTEIVLQKPYEDAGYSITISINPLVKLLMSNDDQVLEVQCLNADSEVAYGDIIDDLIGEPVTRATQAIVLSAIEQGYLKENASCTISCEDVWETSEGLVEQFAQIHQTVQNVLLDENREDAVVVMDVVEAVEILESAGVQVDEEFKVEFVDGFSDVQLTESQEDDNLWPNVLFIMKPGEFVEEVVYLNDSANRAYAGVTQDVVDMKDTDAAKIYLAAAYENGYLKEQFDYDSGPNIPRWIHDKLLVFRNYDEAFYDGLIPIPHEFWTLCPRVALLVDDNERISEVLYLNDSAVKVLSGIDFVGKDPMSASGTIVSKCYKAGYIRFTNIPAEMFEHIITVCNEEEALQMGLK